MRINTRFTVAVHVMALVALAQRQGALVTSELLARSVGTNPVVIRQMMSSLKKAGLIQTQSGLPGCSMKKAECEISLLDIYKAVQKDTDAPLFDFHPHPNPKCFVGRNIQGAMEHPLREAQDAMERSLGEYTLQDVTSYISKNTEN